MEVPTFWVCAVIQIPLYARLGLLRIISQNIGVDLRHVYLFCPTSPQGSILDKPFLSSTAEFYLGQAKIDEGETLHSFRSGWALALAFSGSPLADIMCHVGWKSSSIASYYMKLADVLRAGVPADALTSALLPVIESSKIYKD